MQTAISAKRVNRVHGVSKIKNNTATNTQRNTGRNNNKHAGIRHTKQPQRNKKIPAPCSSFGVNLTGITFPSKLGYHIFLKYRTNVNFSKQEKIKALMIYNCIKHLPGFIDKQFFDVNDAVAYVYQHAETIIGHRYGFAINDSNSEKEMPEEYYMQIIYEEIDSSAGRWQSYDGINTFTSKDLKLRKAIYMCMHLITCDFGFTIFDKEGDRCIMDMDNYAQWQGEMWNDELNNELREFEVNYSREFDAAIDSDTAQGIEINSIMAQIEEIDDYVERYETVAVPMQKRILKTKPNIKFLKEQAEIHKDRDVGKWISHIVFLKKQKFSIHDYVATSYKDVDDLYDDESLMPTSAFGYIFDGDSGYAQDADANYNEDVGNCCIIPFCIHTTICPERGIIYKSANVPLGAWIQKIISFSFVNLRYETYK